MSSETIPNPDSGAGDPVPADDALRQERDDLRDRLLRTSAEFDNYRKRTDRERREQAEYASADLAKDLLPVVDDLERALEAAGGATGNDARLASLRDGVEMIHRQFLDILQRRGVETVATVGTTFDPAWHEALATQPVTDGLAEGEITAEIRRGYRIGQRLLRAALVKVAQS
jgi:molecular chaperone GrpE